MFAHLAQLVLVTFTLVTAIPAHAAPLAYGTYYDENNGTMCSGIGSCQVNFSQLPADKLLMVGKVSCTVSGKTPSM
jgi:hypothetical protein